MKRTMLALLLVMSLSACGDWFGNDPLEKHINCDPRQQIIKPPKKPNPNVEANWGIQVEINALKSEADGLSCEEYPVPFEFHLYGTADGVPGLYLDTGQPLPYDGPAVTPFVTDVFVLRTAKTWMVDIIATAGPAPKDIDVVFFCNIWILEKSGVISAHSTYLTHATNTVHCFYTYRGVAPV